MKVWVALIIALLAAATTACAHAQRIAIFPRLPADALDARPPDTGVSGPLGAMSLPARSCRSDVADSQLRRRIVDIAVQEWGFFGFPTVAQTAAAGAAPLGNSVAPSPAWSLSRRLANPNTDELLRTATTVAGYWAATPDGAWILSRQNEVWSGEDAEVAWLDAWSAAFVSWVMCEAGLATSARFRRAIAHHAYIDQAIRARDGQAPDAVFVAYDIGERMIAPGDLLCVGQNPAYRNLAARRAQLGQGASTHCDIVVAVDVAQGMILAIGGNLRGTVAMKIIPAPPGANGILRPVNQAAAPGEQVIFAHLQLRLPAIEWDAVRASPTLRAVRCTPGFAPPMQLTALGLTQNSSTDGDAC